MNSVHLIGRITRDIELKHTINDMPYISFTLAVPRDYDKEITDFISCVAWKKRAEIIQKYAKKGHKIGISGQLQVNSNVGRNGEKRNFSTVIISNFKFLQYKKDNTDDKNKDMDKNEDIGEFEDISKYENIGEYEDFPF